LHAIAALAKKAKQADLKQYVAGGIDDAVMAVYKTIKAALALQDGTTIDLLSQQTPGPLQESLTKRKGTITVIAEYKRTNSEADATGYINEIFAPDLLSPVFREAGASAMAVMADKRMGGCSYEDLALVIEEQRRAGNQVPGPIAIINNDLIIDELQVARSAAMGCAAFVLQFDMVGADDCVMLLQAAQAVGIEAIVAVSNAQDAQQAIDSGARLLCVIHVEGVANKVAVVQDLVVPEGQQVCKIANILARNNKQLAEIEEAWSLRDQGFQAVWVGEALYKSGADFTEHPGAIIKAMKSKSSTKWASAKGKPGRAIYGVYSTNQYRCMSIHIGLYVDLLYSTTLHLTPLLLACLLSIALSGRGEGAREYLGDILM
jgi:indole-3-glycerol phosphate synthase